ncbi:MAG: hypothetical protein ACE5FQ_16420, partial [Thiogranum sp.]
MTLAIVNARIYTLTDQGIIERGRILIEDGRILALGSSIDVSTAGRIIDASGKQVTPGLMNAFTTLGLTEIDLVEDTVDAATSDVMFSAGFAIASAL